MLVEAVGGDRGLEQLDDVVDVRALAEQRQRVGVPLLGDGVACCAGSGGRRARPARGDRAGGGAARAWRNAGSGAPRTRSSETGSRCSGFASSRSRRFLSSSSRTSARACPRASASPRSTACRISSQMAGGTRADSGLGAAHGALRPSHRRRRDPLADAPPSPAGCARAGWAPRARARPRCCAWTRRSRTSGSLLGSEPGTLELEEDHLVDGPAPPVSAPCPRPSSRTRRRLPGRRARRVSPRRQRVIWSVTRARTAFPRGLAHRTGRTHQRVGPSE